MRTHYTTYKELATMPEEEFSSRIYYSLNVTTMTNSGGGSIKSTRVSFYYVDENGEPSPITIYDAGVRVDGYGQSQDAPTQSRFPGDKCAFKVMYGPMSDRSSGAAQTPADVAAPNMVGTGLRLLILVAGDCADFVGHGEAEVKLGARTPYEVTVKEGQTGARARMINSDYRRPGATQSNFEHFSKFFPKMKMMTKSGPGAPLIAEFQEAIKAHIGKHDPALILRRYASKGHNNKTASLTLYQPQLDFRSPGKETMTSARVTVTEAMYEGLMKRSASVFKPARRPKASIVTSETGPVAVISLGPWEILGGDKDRQLRTKGDIFLVPELFFGAKSVFRCVVSNYQIMGTIEREQAPLPGYRGAPPTGSGAEEDGDDDGFLPEMGHFGSPPAPPSGARAPETFRPGAE